LTFAFVNSVHGQLTRTLPTQSGIRDVPVGISHNRYQPPPCKESLLAAMRTVLEAINSQADPYSKALVATVLLSYLQAFEDGNKRTARMVGHAMMLQAGTFP
jgi:Fic family protein